MRIGIDAHIILPKHKRYNPAIAKYTEDLVTHLVEAEGAEAHTWVVFFDQRMRGTDKMGQFEKLFQKRFGKDWKKKVVVKHFPFVQYRKYLPVVYSHMLISSFLTGARLDIFHSPEGLIPYLYPGKIVTTFHYIPRGVGDSGIFVRTFMLGARAAFAQLCRRASRIIVSKENDKKILMERHGFPGERVVVMENSNGKAINWKSRVAKLLNVYEEVGQKAKKAKSKAA
ncbi:MAG: hypothetical protein AAB538_02010 [Patescibacteria group bacterium]